MDIFKLGDKILALLEAVFGFWNNQISLVLSLIHIFLKELINEVNRIGININQIVFNSNAQLYSMKDREQLVAYMKKLNQSVSEAVVKIGNQ